MKSALAFATLFAACWIGSAIEAAPPSSYPRVYGPAGKPYGPTQAHYQYQRQYGRPWYGGGGISRGYTGYTAGYRGNVFGGFLGYGGYFGGYGAYPGFGAFGSPAAIQYHFAPYGYYSGYFVNSGVAGYPAVYTHPTIQALGLQPNVQPLIDNPVLQDARLENQRRWEDPIQVEPIAKPIGRHLKASTPEAKIRSIRIQAAADKLMREQSYSKAYLRYRDAIQVAADRPELHYRQGLALVALRRFSSAVDAFKRAIEADRKSPVDAESLDDIYGIDNQLAKTSYLHKVADWVREDIRDPDRLFLMGTLLYLDDQSGTASEFFETAYRLSGGGDHLAAFLTLGEPRRGQVVPNRVPVGIEQEGDVERALDDVAPPLPAPPLPGPPEQLPEPELPTVDGPKLPLPQP